MGWSDTNSQVTIDLVSRLAYFEYRPLIALSLSLSLSLWSLWPVVANTALKSISNPASHLTTTV